MNKLVQNSYFAPMSFTGRPNPPLLEVTNLIFQGDFDLKIMLKQAQDHAPSYTDTIELLRILEREPKSETLFLNKHIQIRFIENNAYALSVSTLRTPARKPWLVMYVESTEALRDIRKEQCTRNFWYALLMFVSVGIFRMHTTNL